MRRRLAAWDASAPTVGSLALGIGGAGRGRAEVPPRACRVRARARVRAGRMHLAGSATCGRRGLLHGTSAWVAPAPWASAVETARQEWVGEYRRFHEEIQEPRRRSWPLSHVELVTAELREAHRHDVHARRARRDVRRGRGLGSRGPRRAARPAGRATSRSSRTRRSTTSASRRDGLPPVTQATTRRHRRRRRRGRRLGIWALRLAIAVVLFSIGVAVGRALEENPDPGVARPRSGP